LTRGGGPYAVRRSGCLWPARRLQRYPDGEHDPWGRPLDERIVLILANWSYAGTGYTTRLPVAALALASADMARGR